MVMYYTEPELELMERNELRLQVAKNEIGPKWLLHPDNRVKRKTNIDKSRVIMFKN